MTIALMCDYALQPLSQQTAFFECDYMYVSPVL